MKIVLFGFGADQQHFLKNIQHTKGKSEQSANINTVIFSNQSIAVWDTSSLDQCVSAESYLANVESYFKNADAIILVSARDELPKRMAETVEQHKDKIRAFSQTNGSPAYFLSRTITSIMKSQHTHQEFSIVGKLQQLFFASGRQSPTVESDKQHANSQRAVKTSMRNRG